jgi:rare lipoprotein A
MSGSAGLADGATVAANPPASTSKATRRSVLLASLVGLMMSPLWFVCGVARDGVPGFRPGGRDWVQEGKASWYGKWHAGKRTASGELFDPNRYTAAHRRLPLGTQVRVTNLDTGRSVIVTITDRGPYVGHRVIDLSAAAAERLGMKRAGIAKVRIEVV